MWGSTLYFPRVEVADSGLHISLLQYSCKLTVVKYFIVLTEGCYEQCRGGDGEFGV